MTTTVTQNETSESENAAVTVLPFIFIMLYPRVLFSTRRSDLSYLPFYPLFIWPCNAIVNVPKTTRNVNNTEKVENLNG